MDNQHRQIKGYRELSQPEIDLMNKIKSKGAELGSLVAELRAVNSQQCKDNATDGAAISALHEAGRWISIGATHLQQGLMALTRAVAKPEFF